MSKNNQIFLLIALLFSTKLVSEQVINLERHNGRGNTVYSMTALNNNTFAAGSCDGKIRIFSIDPDGSYSCKKTLSGHTGIVFSLAKLNDTTFASGSEDLTIRIWEQNVDDYICKAELTDLSNRVLKIVALGSERFVSNSGYNTIKIWKKKPNGDYFCTNTYTQFPHSNYVTAITKLNHGGFALGGDEGDIMLCKITKAGNSFYTAIKELIYAEQELDSTYYPLGVKVHSLVQLDNGDLIAGYSGKIHTYALTKDDADFSADNQGIIHPQQNNCMPLLTPLYNGRFASLNDHSIKMDGYKIKIWEKQASGLYTCIKKLAGNTTVIYSVTQLGNGHIVSGDADGIIRIFRESDLQHA